MKQIKRIKQAPVTIDAIDRVKSWYHLESKYGDNITCYPVVLHTTINFYLEYIKKNLPGWLLDQNKDGNQAVHFPAEWGHIDCFRYLIDQSLDPQFCIKP